MADKWLQQLVNDGTISAAQLKEAENLAAAQELTVIEALLQLNYIDPDLISQRQANYFGYEFAPLDNLEVPQETVTMIPESFAREYMVMPLKKVEETLKVAISDPMAIDALDKLRFILNQEIAAALAPESKILTSINRHYGPDNPQTT